MFLNSDRFQLLRPGPRPKEFGVLPSARMAFTAARLLGTDPPAPGAENAAALKYCSTVRLSFGRLGSPVITARQPSPPPVISRLPSRLLVPRVPRESGAPLWKRVMPDICQPSNTCFTTAWLITRLSRGTFHR